MPVTCPDALTLATAGFELDQVVVRPVRVAPDADRVIAVSCCEAATSIVMLAGVTPTEATGIGMTVIAERPERPHSSPSPSRRLARPQRHAPKLSSRKKQNS